MMIAPPALLSPAIAPVPCPPVPDPEEPPAPKLPSGSVAYRVQSPFTKHASATAAFIRHIADSSAVAQSASVLHSSVQTPQRQASPVPQTASESQLRSQFGFEAPLLADSLPHAETIANAVATDAMAEARERTFTSMTERIRQ
jgi:hypothetical protein